MSDELQWPELPAIAKNDPQKEVKEALYQARLEVIKADHQVALDKQKADHQTTLDKQKTDYQTSIDAEKATTTAYTEREKAIWANEYAQAQAFYSAYIDVAKEQLSRMAAKAEFVQKAAGAIGGAYTAILAFTFAVSESGTTPLPPRGIIPAIFLGLSVVLATGYLAYVTRPESTPEPLPYGTFEMRQRERRNTFITWAGRSGIRRLYLLQASIFALGFGVAFLPAPYIKADQIQIGIISGDQPSTLSGNTLIWILAIASVFLTFVLPALIGWLLRRRTSSTSTT